MAPGTMRKLEVFISCRNVSRFDERLFDSFAVLFLKPPHQSAFVEVDRTETLTQSMSPAFSTSMVVDYDELQMPWTQVRVDVYERRTIHTERLRDHQHRCTTTTTVADILHAPGMQFTAQLYHPVDHRKVGILYITAESIDYRVTPVLDEDTKESSHPIDEMMTSPGVDLSSTVKLDITASLLRKRDWNKTVVNQRYELLRMHRYADEDGNPVWIVVHRSDRMGKPRNQQCKVEFSTADLSMRHLCNGDEERNMRLVFYAQSPDGKKQLLKRGSGGTIGGVGFGGSNGGSTGAGGINIIGGGGGSGIKRRVSTGAGGGGSDGGVLGSAGGSPSVEIRVATAEFSLRSLCEMNPTAEVLELQTESETEDVGVITIERAEPTDFGSHFCLRVLHESTGRFLSTAGGGMVDAAVMQRRKVPRKLSLMPNVSRGLSRVSDRSRSSEKRPSNPTIDALFTFDLSGSGGC